MTDLNRDATGGCPLYLRETAYVVGRVEAESLDDIVAAAELLVTSLREGGKILICGNGGSAADAQHGGGGERGGETGGAEVGGVFRWGAARSLADIAIKVPSTVTAHVQECHLAVEHLLATIVERDLYPLDAAGG